VCLGLRLQEEEFLKRYIEYCRCKMYPALTEEAASVLASEYVTLREQVSSTAQRSACAQRPSTARGKPPRWNRTRSRAAKPM
jgi:DNA replicative helicase MCM subunit Mcm2 (Cdc46/Mcm family)